MIFIFITKFLYFILAIYIWNDTTLVYIFDSLFLFLIFRLLSVQQIADMFENQVFLEILLYNRTGTVRENRLTKNWPISDAKKIKKLKRCDLDFAKTQESF